MIGPLSQSKPASAFPVSSQDLTCGPPTLRRLADHGAEQRPLAIAHDACGPDVRIEIFFELAVTGHFVEFTVFLVRPEPPALFLRKIILDGERDNGPDAGEDVSASI
jgi:hypothetical protein